MKHRENMPKVMVKLGHTSENHTSTNIYCRVSLNIGYPQFQRIIIMFLRFRAEENKVIGVPRGPCQILRAEDLRVDPGEVFRHLPGWEVVF